MSDVSVDFAKKTVIEYAYKKQTGGCGMYAKVVLEFQRCEEKGFHISNAITDESIPKKYVPGIEEGLNEALLNSALAGYPYIGLKVTIADGKSHPIDSSESSFKMAAMEAFNSYLKKIAEN